MTLPDNLAMVLDLPAKVRVVQLGKGVMSRVVFEQLDVLAPADLDPVARVTVDDERGGGWLMGVRRDDGTLGRAQWHAPHKGRQVWTEAENDRLVDLDAELVKRGTPTTDDERRHVAALTAARDQSRDRFARSVRDGEAFDAAREAYWQLPLVVLAVLP